MYYERLVEDLGIEHRARNAQRSLQEAGAAATPAVRRGLLHDNPAVRVRCCTVLDHHLDEAAVPELIANLDHQDHAVRTWAMHALACDRCKEGACRPGEDDTVPLAIRMLADDESKYVRKEAIQLLGPAVHRRADVAAALESARDRDPDPLVRKVAGWWAPGGPIYKRLAPKPDRTGVRATFPPAPTQIAPRPVDWDS